jgi:3-oxoacyl-[acyl-carrier protein] reductase
VEVTTRRWCQWGRKFACDIDSTRLAAFAKEAAVATFVLDIADKATAHKAVADLAARHGRLDILVNAARGVRGQIGRLIAEVEEEGWRAIFAAKVDGAFSLSQAASLPMQKQKFGRIINIEPWTAANF